LPTKVARSQPRSEGLTASKRWEEFTFGPYKRLPSRQERVGEFYLMSEFDPTVGEALDVIDGMILSHIGDYEHEDPDIAEFVNAELAPILRETIRQLLSALWAGFAVAEIVWRVDGATWGVDRVELLHPLTFFPPAGGGFGAGKKEGIALDPKTKKVTEVTQWGGADGREEKTLAADKVIYWPRSRQLREQTYGRSLLNRARRAWYAKCLLENYWNTFGEKSALPTVLFITPQGEITKADGTPQSLAEALVEAYNEAKPGSAVGIPGDPQTDTKTERLGVEGDGSAFEAIVGYWDTQLYKALLTPRMMLEEPEHGSRAQASTMMEAFLLLLQGTCEEVGEVIVGQLVTRLIDYNFGEQADYGRLAWQELSPKDLDLLASVFERVARALAGFASSGLEFNAADEEKVRDVFGEVLATYDEAQAAAEQAGALPVPPEPAPEAETPPAPPAEEPEEEAAVEEGPVE